MGSLADNTVLTHPDTGVPVSLLKGQEIPDWADGLVGDHLIEAAEEPKDPVEGETPKGNASRDAWADFAETKGAPEEETRPVEDGGLKQTELRDKYGK